MQTALTEKDLLVVGGIEALSVIYQREIFLVTFLPDLPNHW